jgi:hypothetical protein
MSRVTAAMLPSSFMKRSTLNHDRQLSMDDVDG